MKTLFTFWPRDPATPFGPYYNQMEGFPEARLFSDVLQLRRKNKYILRNWEISHTLRFTAGKLFGLDRTEGTIHPGEYSCRRRASRNAV